MRTSCHGRPGRRHHGGGAAPAQPPRPPRAPPQTPARQRASVTRRQCTAAPPVTRSAEVQHATFGAMRHAPSQVTPVGLRVVLILAWRAWMACMEAQDVFGTITGTAWGVRDSRSAERSHGARTRRLRGVGPSLRENWGSPRARPAEERRALGFPWNDSGAWCAFCCSFFSRPSARVSSCEPGDSASTASAHHSAIHMTLRQVGPCHGHAHLILSKTCQGVMGR